MSNGYPLERSSRRSAGTAFDGVSTTFGPFGFKIVDPLDVVVETRPVGDAIWKSAADVTVNKGSADPDTFTITFDTVHPSTMEYRVRGARIHERAISLSSGAGLSIPALAREMMVIGIVLQELRSGVDENPETMEAAVERVAADVSRAESASETATLKAGEAEQSALQAAIEAANLEAYRDAFQDYGYLADWGSITEVPGEILDYGDITA
jgi:hypothetical protein